MAYMTVSLRFRRWSRHSYAAFCSVGRHVTIGRLASDIVDASLRKEKSVHSRFFSKRALSSSDYDLSAGYEDYSGDSPGGGGILWLVSIMSVFCGMCFFMFPLFGGVSAALAFLVGALTGFFALISLINRCMSDTVRTAHKAGGPFFCSVSPCSSGACSDGCTDGHVRTVAPTGLVLPGCSGGFIWRIAHMNMVRID